MSIPNLRLYSPAYIISDLAPGRQADSAAIRGEAGAPICCRTQSPQWRFGEAADRPGRRLPGIAALSHTANFTHADHHVSGLLAHGAALSGGS